MKKKIMLSSIFILLLLISPFITSGSAYNTKVSRRLSVNTNNGLLFPFWFICHVNTSGYGKAVHSGNDMFIAIEYDDSDVNINTTLKSFLHKTFINQSHKLQLFFFVGDSNLPPSGVKGDCSLNGMALMVNIW